MTDRQTRRGVLRFPVGCAPAVLVVFTCVGASGTGAQETEKIAVRGVAPVSSEVRDRAGLFGAGELAAARRDLERIEHQTGAATLIETVDTLQGESPREAAAESSRRSGVQGLFILIARKERKLEVLGTGRFRVVFTDARLGTIREAFLGGFQRQDFNDGLKRGVTAIEEELASARRAGDFPRTALPGVPSGRSSVADGRSNTGSALVLREQVRLTLAGARVILAGAEAKAREMGWKMNLAVVDDGGHLLAFERMDGARPASGYTAITKATTAATFRQPTGPVPTGTTSPDPLLNLSLQNAALASGGKITTLQGGVPVVVDGQVIGGVGVGGGTGEQDAQAAKAGIQALLDQIATGPERKDHE